MNIRAIFPAGQTQITVNGLHQWDYGRKLEIQATDLPSIIEVHFACAGMKEAVVRICGTIDGVAVAAIPDQCLEQTSPITAWVYAVGDTSGSTVKTIKMPISARTKPPYFAPMPADISDKYTEALAAFNDAVEGLRDGKLVALEAEHATNADRATLADSATDADHATLADSATNADRATLADSATNADHASSADQASTAEYASMADYASSADRASSADYATEALRFSENAVVPRAERATLAEGIVDEIDGEPVYVPYADFATNASNANTAARASSDRNGSLIDLTYARNPIRKTFTNTTLASPVQIGVFSTYDDFAHITTLTMRVYFQDGLRDGICVFTGDVYGAQSSGSTTEERTKTMHMVCTQALFNTNSIFNQYTIGISGALVLEKATKKLSFVADSNAFVRKYQSHDGSTDIDTWEQVSYSDLKVESIVVSFA